MVYWEVSETTKLQDYKMLRLSFQHIPVSFLLKVRPRLPYTGPVGGTGATTA